MAKDWNYKSGDWNLICDVCGKKMKASHARHRWDGLIVCDEDFEHRHAQDFLRVKSDKITVPYTRPVPTDIFRYTTPWDEDNPPFLNQVLVTDTFSTITAYQRNFGDTVSVADLALMGGFVQLGDAGDIVSVLDSMTILNDAVPLFGDNTGTGSSGYIWHNDYIDGTYFVSTYVASSTATIT